MSETKPQGERPSDARLDRFSDGGGANVGRIVVGGLFGVVFVAGLLFLIAPEVFEDMVSGDASDAEDMQTSEPEPGISTAITREPEIDIDVEMPEAEPVILTPPTPDEPDPPDERLAELAERLARLAERQNGMDPEELQRRLDDQATRLNREFEERQATLERAHEAELRAARAVAAPARAGLSPTADPAADAERRRRQEEERARRQAILNDQIASEGVVLDSGQRLQGGASGGVERDLNQNERFLASASTDSHETVAASRIPDPDRTIVQGAIIEAVLETAVSTELPGIARAVTTVDTYSYDGSTVLIPRGSRLIGQYSSDVKLAQQRALVAWSRAVTPDGTTVSLGGYGADTLGRAGQDGYVDSRFLERFGAAALISLIGTAPSLVVGDDADAELAEIADDASQDAQRATDSVAREYLRLPPIIYIDQGTPITIIVNRDLVF